MENRTQQLYDLFDLLLTGGLSGMSLSEAKEQVSGWIEFLSSSSDPDITALVLALQDMYDWLDADDTSDLTGLRAAFDGISKALLELPDGSIDNDGPTPGTHERRNKQHLSDMGHYLGCYAYVNLT